MVTIEQEAIVVLGLTISFWVAYFSYMWGIIIGFTFGIAMSAVLCFIDWCEEDPNFSLFDWGKRKGKLIYGEDIVAIKNEHGEIEWKFLKR
jgi:hypothetical protein